jgi:hypothetical protein
MIRFVGKRSAAARKSSSHIIIARGDTISHNDHG